MKRFQRPRALPLWCWGVVLAGCGTYDLVSPLDAPVPLNGALAFLHRETQSLVIVDPNGGAGPTQKRKIHRVPVGVAPTWARALPKPGAPNEQVVMVADPGANEVIVVRDKTGATQHLTLGVPMKEVEVSSDGRWGIAYQPDGAATTGSLVAFPNTISILNLQDDPPTSSSLRLGAGGARPIAVRFSEPLQMLRDTTVHTSVVAFVFVRGGLVPVDLHHGAVAPFVPVTLDTDAPVTPAEVLFTNNQGDALVGAIDELERAFVRTTSGELFVFSLSLQGPADAPLLVALENIVTPDAKVEDIELYFDEQGQSLLLAAAGDELILVDGFSGVASRLPSPTPVDRLVRFVDVETSQHMAIGYSHKTPRTQLLRINPLRLMERRSTGLSPLTLANSVQQVDVDETSRRAVLRYHDERDVGVLELTQDGELLDLAMFSVPVAQALIDRGERMLIASENPVDGHMYLSEIDLGTFAIQSVQLVDAVARVGSVGSFVWSESHHHGGTVTFFPKGSLRRDAAMRFSGLAYARLLESPLPTEQRGDEP